jgi:hypothetical protein
VPQGPLEVRQARPSTSTRSQHFRGGLVRDHVRTRPPVVIYITCLHGTVSCPLQVRCVLRRAGVPSGFPPTPVVWSMGFARCPLPAAPTVQFLLLYFAKSPRRVGEPVDRTFSTPPKIAILDILHTWTDSMPGRAWWILELQAVSIPADKPRSIPTLGLEKAVPTTGTGTQHASSV